MCNDDADDGDDDSDGKDDGHGDDKDNSVYELSKLGESFIPYLRTSHQELVRYPTYYNLYCT